jgi:putative DNA primase/helicase
MRKNGDRNINDIARLQGTRFVTTMEAEQGRRLSEPLIRKITRNDQMTARFLYGEKQDKHLESKLREEASRILNWLLEGTRRWKQERLKVPAAILNATDEYRGEMDVIWNFIRERCIQKPGVAIRARELFQLYQDWCEENTNMLQVRGYSASG